MSFRDRMYQFMQGRYGVDQMGKSMSAWVLGLIIINLFIHSRLLSSITLAMLVYIYFRMLSRNFAKRSKENEWYLRVSQPFATICWRIKSWFRKTILKNRQSNSFRANDYGNVYTQKKVKDNTHKIYKCPNCKQKVRVPKGRGKIEIRCPKCATTFIKRT